MERSKVEHCKGGLCSLLFRLWVLDSEKPKLFSLKNWLIGLFGYLTIIRMFDSFNFLLKL